MLTEGKESGDVTKEYVIFWYNGQKIALRYRVVC